MDFSFDANEKFDWDTFLERRQAEPAPNFSFHHVEKAEQSLIEEGMCVEVQHHSGSQVKFWFAKVNMKCGPFLRLKYVGQEKNCNEFWADPLTIEIHPVGYCLAHNLPLKPPQEFPQNFNSLEVINSVMEQHKVTDCNISLLSLVQQVKPGSKLEVEDVNQSRTVWIATVIRNIGGRLLLRYLLQNNTSSTVEDFETWIFCLSPRLHSLGWASKQSSWIYKPPKKILPLCGDEWPELSLCFQKEMDNKRTLGFPTETKKHSFLVGSPVEVLDPSDPTALKAATVVEVVDDHRFTVRLNSPLEEETLCYFASDECVFPRAGGSGSSCEQLEMNTLESDNRPNDLGFDCNMVLEVVNPWKPTDMCVGAIVDIRSNLLKIHLETPHEDTISLPDILAPCSSFDLFPVGWCESHCYPLHGPPSRTSSTESVEQSRSEVFSTKHPETEILPASVSYWCPKIYFNFRCFSGPLLSKLRIAALPRSVGPGPILLVLKEVLSLLINGAYKPGSVLKQLQGEPGAPLPKGTQLEPLKAKYKQTTYRGSIPIASTAGDVSDYCKWVCEKLQCCTCLFGPDLVGDPCPRRCCVTMVKVHWQHKKRAAKFNGRNKKPVETLKNLPVESTPLSVSEEGANANSTNKTEITDSIMENSDDSNEPSESTTAIDTTVRYNVATKNTDGTSRSSRTIDDHRSEEVGDSTAKALRRSILDTSIESCNTKRDTEKLDENVKKKRGRPRKHMKNPVYQSLSSQMERTFDDSKIVDNSLPFPLFPLTCLPLSIPLSTQVSEWTVQQVVGYLVQCGIAKGHLEKFFDEEIDGEAFLCLSPVDLMELLQMRLGPVIKAQNALLLIREQV